MCTRRPTWRTTIHTENDPRVGQPICPDCYDYPAHIAFNWHAPELWRRFTIALRRTLAQQANLTVARFRTQAEDHVLQRRTTLKAEEPD